MRSTDEYDIVIAADDSDSYRKNKRNITVKRHTGVGYNIMDNDDINDIPFKNPTLTGYPGDGGSSK
jgi:hypothetical protein